MSRLLKIAQLGHPVLRQKEPGRLDHNGHPGNGGPQRPAGRQCQPQGDSSGRLPGDGCTLVTGSQLKVHMNTPAPGRVTLETEVGPG